MGDPRWIQSADEIEKWSTNTKVCLPLLEKPIEKMSLIDLRTTIPQLLRAERGRKQVGWGKKQLYSSMVAVGCITFQECKSEATRLWRYKTDNFSSLCYVQRLLRHGFAFQDFLYFCLCLTYLLSIEINRPPLFPTAKFINILVEPKRLPYKIVQSY